MLLEQQFEEYLNEEFFQEFEIKSSFNYIFIFEKKTYMQDEQIFVCCWQGEKGNNKKQKEHVNLNAIA